MPVPYDALALFVGMTNDHKTWSLMSNHNLGKTFCFDIVKTPTQLNLNLSWVKHENAFANPNTTPPPHHPQKLNVSNISIKKSKKSKV